MLGRTLLVAAKSVIERLVTRPVSTEDLFAQAGEKFRSGQVAEAVEAYRRIVERDPTHLWAWTEMGNCYVALSKAEEAATSFQNALSVDDSFAPALVNLAVRFNEDCQSGPAMELLSRAREIAPDHAMIDASIAATWMTRGEPDLASLYHLSAWLKAFDSLEPGHCYLFTSTYSEGIAAETITAEHLFWANTLAPATTRDDFEPGPFDNTRRLRIGYISPDFRNHSLRYFSRPLIEGHDRSRVDVFCYYDCEWEDAHTEAIRAAAGVFRKIANLPAERVREIIRNDDLDVLIELAGHTSVSRLHLFDSRLARIHCTGLGYPPTTGLDKIDFKLADDRLIPESEEHLYAEKPLRLEHSFWCFNPCAETVDPNLPPCLENGHVTFGCFGNISKISPSTLACWGRILEALPDAKLIIKSISFQDAAARSQMLDRLEMAGADLTRISLENPDQPEKFFSAFHHVDAILDTTPFCGGTTSCFALWMGVPIITLAGSSVSSRMSTSMLGLLGMNDCIARTPEEYVSKALALASNPERLAEIRRTTRDSMLNTGLSNGKLFASHLEDALLAELRKKSLGAVEPADGARRSVDLPKVEAAELIRRAQLVLQTGNILAARRILEYTRSIYPRAAAIDILTAQSLEMQGDRRGAEALLRLRLQSAQDSEDRISLLINLNRLLLLKDPTLPLEPFDMSPPAESLAFSSVRLIEAAAEIAKEDQAPDEMIGISPVNRVTVLTNSSSSEHAAQIERSYRELLGEVELRFVNMPGLSPLECFTQFEARGDDEVVVWSDPGLEPRTSNLAALLGELMESYDLAGSAGTTEVEGANWDDSSFRHLRGARMVHGQQPGVLELEVYGPHQRSTISGCAGLDPSLLVFRASLLESVRIDTELTGTHPLALFDWTIQVACTGRRVACDARLLAIRHEPLSRGNGWAKAQERFRSKHALVPPRFDLYRPIQGNGAAVPLAESIKAGRIVRRYFV